MICDPEILCSDRHSRNNPLLLRQLFNTKECRGHMQIFFCFQSDDI
jgi:hypothetical protein